SMAYAVWDDFLRFNPADPGWPDRDRFILSAGHGSMLLYTLLHLTGYDLPLSELQNFRQWDSLTPGHPEHGLTPGVETTTGPLGQGISNAVGMAMAEAFLAARFNHPGHTLVDHRTIVIASDGDLMEGVASEAASLAGHLGLGKLIVLYDDNHITIEGDTTLAFQEDVGRRFEAYGWQVQGIEDGNDLASLRKALEHAVSAFGKPSLIRVRTHIAYGSPNKQDTAAAHGAPLGAEEVRLTKENLGWPAEPTFHIPAEVRQHMKAPGDRGRKLQEEWHTRRDAYREKFPAEYESWARALRGELPKGWDEALPTFDPKDGSMATRKASGAAINALAPRIPEFLGGSADLAPSTNTLIKGGEDFTAGNPGGRNLRFGVREHGMAAILNGMAVHGGVRPYGATFLIFSDYMRPSIRLAALMGLPVIYVFTHDSIGLGEDGPTHQPIEHLAALRAIPNLTLIRPADANETVQAWRYALQKNDGPVALVLTRQGLPIYERRDVALSVSKGATILADTDGTPDIILIATGSEVAVAMEARDILGKQGVAARVVSLPSWEIFERQPEDYRNRILPPAVGARLAIEAATAFGWERWTGSDGEIVGLNRFGASAPGKVVMQKLGFCAQNVADRARALLERHTQPHSGR
ncbi:MAG: transketolase, partial [Acidobacteria bacterium]|nr:transketolase [Acidobacteriota bacterium]